MSEENSPSSETPAETKPRVRRVSNPRPKKTAPVKSAAKKEAAAPAEAAPAAETVSSPAPVSAPQPSPAESASAPEREFSENVVESTSSQEWPEPETSEGSSGQGEGKRKRRRRKGKGGQNASSGGNEESSGQQAAPQQQPRTNGGHQGGHQQGGHQQPAVQSGQPHQHTPRTPVEPEALAKKAWKIYLSEVSEEGIALINDHDAKELSRRCFRLAEIFLDEQSRRLRQ